MKGHVSGGFNAVTSFLLLAVVVVLGLMAPGVRSQPPDKDSTTDNAIQLVTQGRQIFPFRYVR